MAEPYLLIFIFVLPAKRIASEGHIAPLVEYRKSLIGIYIAS